MRAEGEELEAVGPRLERARGARADADRVQRLDLADIVVELHAAAAADDDVDLLGARMAVGERAALAGAQPEVRDAGRLGAERLASGARLPAVAEAVARRRV